MPSGSPRFGLLARLVALALLLEACAAAPTRAQRAPALQQVKVPHNYYWREMYVPQVTSGPSAAAWSPDGASSLRDAGLVVAAASRERYGARQLTDGAGYDHQPDWSPDGRWVVVL